MRIKNGVQFVESEILKYNNEKIRFTKARRRIESISRHLYLLHLTTEEYDDIYWKLLFSLSVDEHTPEWEGVHPSAVFPEFDPRARWNKKSYADFLNSVEWEWVRWNMLLRVADYRCQICNSEESLQVHHRSYDRLGEEHFSAAARKNLVVLCSRCHYRHHRPELHTGIRENSR